MGLKEPFAATMLLGGAFAGWNQTKMGLKGTTAERSHSITGSVEIRPKWDWKTVSLALRPWVLQVEIRPKWDWKGNVLVEHEEFCRRLKSDQNGIERAEIAVYNLADSKSGWNQTKMGLKVRVNLYFITKPFYSLKSDQNGIERFQPISHHPA